MYEIFRVLRFRTTEYMPFNLTAGAILLQAQYWVYAFVLNDTPMRRANEVSIAFAIFATFSY